MTRESDAVTVLLLACETNDRAPDEQRAVLNEALRLDLERGAFTYWRKPEDAPVPPTLVAHAEATYEPSSGRHVTLTEVDRKRYARLREQWRLCDDCGYPLGAHGIDTCPTRPLPGLVRHELATEDHEEHVRALTLMSIADPTADAE